MLNYQRVSTAFLTASEPQPFQHPRHSEATITRGVGQLDVQDTLWHNLQLDGNLLQWDIPRLPMARYPMISIDLDHMFHRKM